MYGIGFLKNVFKTWKIVHFLQKKIFFSKNDSTDFKKSSIEKPPTFLCACILHCYLFAVPFCLQALKKSVGECSTDIFDYFCLFFQSEILVQINRTDSKIVLNFC